MALPASPAEPKAPAAPTADPAPAADEEDLDYGTIVRGRRPPRSATDFTFALGQRRGAPPAGGTGAELLRHAPGVVISQHSGEGKAHQIFLRGFDAVHGQDVEIQVGGIPVNEVSNVHSQGYADLHFLIPEAVSTMRVLEGAFDPRQGDFAVAGSVDFDLGLRRRGVLASLSAGRFGLVRAVVGWGPRSQPEETFVVAELARSDGFGPNRTWRRGGAMGQALVELPGPFELRLLASTYAGRFDSAGVLRLEDINSGARGIYDTYDPAQGGASDRHQLLLEARYHDGPTRAALSSYVVLRELRLRHNFTGALLEPNEKLAQAGVNQPQGDLAEQQNDAVTLGGRGMVRRAVELLGRLHGLELGVLWRHDRVDQAQRRLRQVDQSPWMTEIDAALVLTDLGLYADLDLELWPWLKLRGGLRADALAYRVEDRLEESAALPRREAFGFHLGPKVTLQARAARWLRLFASYGKGFRSPYALSLGQGEDAPFTTVHAGEAGARLDFGPRLRATAAGFVTYVDDDLVFDHASGRTLHSGATLRGGATLLLESVPLSWLHALLSLTYTRAVYADSGATVPYAPPLVLRLDLEGQRRLTHLWQKPLSLFGSLGLSLWGPRPLPYDEKTATVALLDLGAGLRWGLLSLSVELFNATDARWYDGEYVYASTFAGDNGQKSLVPARHVTVGRPLMAQGTITINF